MRKRRYIDLKRMLKPCLETIVLFFIILACVYFVLLIRADDIKSPDIFLESLICLVTSVVLSHFILILNRNRSSKNITKYIDYVYLSVAALGLLSAMDYSGKNYTKNVQVLSDGLNSLLAVEKSTLDRDIAAYCAEPTNDPSCPNIDKLSEVIDGFLKYSENEIKYSLNDHPALFIGAASIYLKSIAAVQDNVIKDPNSKFKKIDFAEFVDVINRYLVPPFGSGEGENALTRVEQVFDISRLRVLGYLFIAAALGLRITRVTVELWSLWSSDVEPRSRKTDGNKENDTLAEAK